MFNFYTDYWTTLIIWSFKHLHCVLIQSISFQTVECLEVHGIPSDLTQEELEEALSDLTSLGIQIEQPTEDSDTRTLLALLPSNLDGADLIRTHSNGNYQLRMCNLDD